MTPNLNGRVTSCGMDRRQFTAEPTECEFGGCREAPMGLYTWGLYPDGCHNDRVPLCASHASEVSGGIANSVQALLMHLAIEPVSSWKGSA